MATSQPVLNFTGHQHLAHRLVLSTLSGRGIRVSQIRSSSATTPGLAPHEISFLRLLESVTNGSHIEISYTGTILVYRPGLIVGSAPGFGASGGVIKHDVPANCTRGIAYFLIPLCLMAPFSKAQMNVLFTGPGVITSSTATGDISVDTVRTAILPIYAKFGIDRNIELRILQRSGPGPRGSGGAGEVQLVFGHQVRLPNTVHLMSPGKIKSIRGVAYAVGVSGSNNARMIETARGVLNPLVPDTYIFSDVASASLVSGTEKNNIGGKRKFGLGFGLSLVAESSTSVLFAADVASPPAGGEPPETVGKACAYALLQSISRGGCVSLEASSTVITLMSMGSEDVSRVQLGRDVLGNENTVQLARDLNKFGAAGWGVRDAAPGDQDNTDLIVSIIGRGIGNVGRKIG